MSVSLSADASTFENYILNDPVVQNFPQKQVKSFFFYC